MGAIIQWLKRGGSMGNTIVLIGPQHSGKTTILMNIFKQAIENDFEIITTTNMFNPPKGIHNVNRASDLFRAYVKTDKKVILAFDDAQAHFDSTSLSSTKKSKTNQRLYIYIAKLQSNMIFVAHQRDKIPGPVWDTEPLEVYAEKPPPGSKEYYMWLLGRKVRVSKSPYKFPKAYIPSWKWDIDMNRLDDKLSDVKGRYELDQIRKNKEAIRRFIGSDNGYTFSKRDEIQVLLKTLEPLYGKKIKINQKLIADIVNVDPGYITRIKHTL